MTGAVSGAPCARYRRLGSLFDQHAQAIRNPHALLFGELYERRLRPYIMS